MATIPCDYNNEILNIYELFRVQVIKTPYNIAIKDEHRSVTYLQLEERVSSIADYISYQVSSNNSKFIGICMAPCVDIIATLFAISKAGFTYIPIDPQYPPERINYIINDAKPALIVSNVQTLNRFKEKNKFNLLNIGCFICLEEVLQQYCHSKPSFSKNTLAYVIYTSGSTGNPKGVMVSHQNILNYAAWVKDYLFLNQEEIFDCSSSFSFDLTVTVSIIPLFYGSTVVICNEDTKKSPADYLRYIQENEISIIKTTPSYFNLLCDFIDIFHLRAIKKIILGGENLSLKYLKEWLSKFPSHIIINEYGPTETTVGVTKAVITSENIHTLEYVPLGSPGLNVKLNVVNTNKEFVTEGEIGELYVGGSCVTAGYLNRNELTEEKFIYLDNNNPASTLMYKTGDLVRFHGSFDCLEYIGRVDEQIKLRGYRVELGEIESYLLNFNGIMLAAVMYRKKGDHEDLVAYYLPERNITINKDNLKDFLQSLLPEYMLPSMYVELKEAALTINGKLDKANLPDVDSIVKEQEVASLITKNSKILSQLKNIWSDLVSLNNIDVSANFFDIGGDSLTLARFCKRLNDYGFNIDLPILFQYPTLESLAKCIDYPTQEIIFNVPHQPKEQRNYMFHQRRAIVSQVLQQEYC